MANLVQMTIENLQHKQILLEQKTMSLETIRANKNNEQAKNCIILLTKKRTNKQTDTQRRTKISAIYL